MNDATKTPLTLDEMFASGKPRIPRTYSVYLAAPITGLSYAAAMKRRVEIAAMFPARFSILNPLATQDFLKGAEIVTPFMGGDEIVGECFGMINKCDLMLVDLLGTKRISVGVCIEMGYAIRACIPIVVMIEAGNVHQHPFVTVPARLVCDTEAKAVAEISAMLKP